MKITDAKFYEINKDKLKAFAQITIDNEFVITGLKVMDSVNGYFVSYPSRKNTKENTNNDPNYKAYIDIAFPITKEARKYINDEILLRYHEFMQSNEANAPVNASVEYPEPQKQGHEPIDVLEEDLPF